jgi:hypothetical protein
MSLIIVVGVDYFYAAVIMSDLTYILFSFYVLDSQMCMASQGFSTKLNYIEEDKRL